MTGTLVHNGHGIFESLSHPLADHPYHFAHSYPPAGRKVIDLSQLAVFQNGQFAAGDVTDVNVGFDRHTTAMQLNLPAQLDVDGRAGDDFEELLAGAVHVGSSHREQWEPVLFVIHGQKQVGRRLGSGVGRAGVQWCVLAHGADTCAVHLRRGDM